MHISETERGSSRNSERQCVIRILTDGICSCSDKKGWKFSPSADRSSHRPPLLLAAMMNFAATAEQSEIAWSAQAAKYELPQKRIVLPDTVQHGSVPQARHVLLSCSALAQSVSYPCKRKFGTPTQQRRSSKSCTQIAQLNQGSSAESIPGQM